MSKKGLGFVFAILSAIFWGTNGTFCALLSNLGLTTINIALLAPIFNMIFFFLVLVFTDKNGFKLTFRRLLMLILNGLLSASVNISYVKSVSYFPVGIVSTLVYCNVFGIMIISRIVFKHKITVQKIGAAVTALFGVGLVLDVFKEGFNLNYSGLIWIFLTMLTWSFMITIEKYLLEEGFDGNAILFYTAIFAVLTLSFASPPWTIVNNITLGSHTSSYALLLILGFGIIPQIGCFSLYMKGLKHIEPSFVQVAYSLDPVVASILGFFVFAQVITMSNLLGILLIVGVVAYTQVKENRAGETGDNTEDKLVAVNTQ